MNDTDSNNATRCEALRNISEDLLVSSESTELVSLVFADLPFLKGPL